MLPESAPGLPLLQQNLNQRLLATQQLNQVVNKAGDDEGLVQVPDAIHVQAAFVEPQREPALDAINWNHDKDSNNILLHFRHVPVGQV
jgi:hypothetical protein